MHKPSNIEEVYGFKFVNVTLEEGPGDRSTLNVRILESFCKLVRKKIAKPPIIYVKSSVQLFSFLPQFTPNLPTSKDFTLFTLIFCGPSSHKNDYLQFAENSTFY